MIYQRKSSSCVVGKPIDFICVTCTRDLWDPLFYQMSGQAICNNPSLQAIMQTGAEELTLCNCQWRGDVSSSKNSSCSSFLKLWASSKMENLLADSWAMATALTRLLNSWNREEKKQAKKEKIFFTITCLKKWRICFGFSYLAYRFHQNLENV